jgi:iron(III) transport system substrate-binding protein
MLVRMSEAAMQRVARAAGAALVAALMSLGTGAAAQTGSAVNPATYMGADRQKVLVEGAKREGALSIYASMPVEDMTALTTAFEKRYGIKPTTWRGGSEELRQRVTTEARAGRFTVDIIDTNGVELEALQREKLLQPVDSPLLADLVPQAVLPHREWTATRLNIFALGYNTSLVKKEDLPKSYRDLLDPKWKGMLGIEAEDTDWFAGVVSDMGEAEGLKLFREIVDANGISVRKGHTLLTNLVASGEVPLALTVYNYSAEQLKQKGAPIDWAVIAPAIARPNGMAIARAAPHPHAAVLFFDFLLGEGQKILADRNIVPASTKIDTDLNKVPFKLVDPQLLLDEADKWEKAWKTLIVGRSK